MAILQQDPASIVHRSLDSLFCEFSLTLTQRQDGEFGLEACLFGKISNFNTWISTRTEDEDERRVAVRVAEGLFEVKRRWLDVFFADFVADETLN